MVASLVKDAPLDEFGYSDVIITSALHEEQLENTHNVLMNLSEDSLLKPFRQMVGQSIAAKRVHVKFAYSGVDTRGAH